MEKAEALDQYRKYVKANPSDKDGARKSFYDTFQVDPEGFSQPKTAFQKQAASRKAGIEVEQHAATQDQEISNAKGKFAGTIANTIPIAATLATGGLAAPLAIGVMGLSGGVAGSYEEAAKIALGADDAAMSGKQVARRLGVDVALSGATQGVATMGTKLLSMAGENVIMPMVARAAAKVDAGKTILGQYGGKVLNQLRSADAAAGGLKVSIKPELEALDASMALRKTGPSDAFKSLWGGEGGNGGLASKIGQWAEKDGTASGLAEIKGEVSQAAFKRAGLNHEEQTALKAFSKKIDEKLGASFSKIGAGDTYAGYKEVQSQLFRFDVGVQLAEMTLGGYVGHKVGGVGGGVVGALGAPLAAKAMAQKGAPWLLEKMLSDTSVAPMAKRAIESMANGNAKEAVAIFGRAASQTGVKEIIGPWMKDAAEKQAPKQ